MLTMYFDYILDISSLILVYYPIIMCVILASG